jgi:hypothetical protein
MRSKTIAAAFCAAALGAAGLSAAATTLAWAQDAVIVPYNPDFSVNPQALTNSCQGEAVRLKYKGATVAAPRAALMTFTPLQVAVVKENDQPTGIGFDPDAGCAANPIEVAHATFKLEGRAETLLLAASNGDGTLSGAARSVMGLRDRGKCPREGRFTVCGGTSNVNGQVIKTTAFVAEQAAGSTPSGSPYFALCEGERSNMVCEVSDELPGGMSFRVKLPKGPPKLEEIKAVQAQVRALVAAMGGA